MHIDSIAALLEPVATAGQMALDEQKQMDFYQREFKPDHSIITKVDPMVEGFLVEHMTTHFPDANILAEEKTRQFDADKPYTFALDPIDGTDAFSQSMAGWCISLALLDRALVPIAGMVFAPKLDLMLFADVGKRVLLNGKPVPAAAPGEPLNRKSNIMVPSSVHRQLDLSGFPGKIRSIGSAALHLTGPVIYPGVYASVDGGSGYIWDVAGAHAIVRSLGYRFEYLAGGDVVYDEMVKGRPVGSLILSGPADRIAALRGCLKKI